MDKNLAKREEIKAEYKWDIESIYPDEADWEKDLVKIGEAAEAFTAFSGRLGESAATLLSALNKRDEIWLDAERVYVYAHQRKDEDNRVAKYQAMTDRTQGMLAKVSAAMAFFTPEFLELSEETIDGFFADENGLAVYRHAVNVILRQRPHVLSGGEESLLAKISEVTSATNDIFKMINDADMKFGLITDEDGDEVELTHGRYIGFMESRDRRVRKEAYEKMYAAYIAQKNTLAATYGYNTKTDVVMSGIRKYPSSLAAALSGDNIPLSVYDSLIESVNGRLGALHKYMEVRKRAMGLSELNMYDVYVPFTKKDEKEIPYGDALETMYQGLSVLGDDYIGAVKKGVESGWIDVYENEGKSSGAYSFGSFDSKPFILLNYAGKLKDVFTIVHEMGHSMHSYYTRKTQPFVYGSHSIFTAETASTVNESLLMRHLLAQAKDNPAERLYLLNLYIEDFRTTLFRQTMFAEFEKLTHEAAERNAYIEFLKTGESDDPIELLKIAGVDMGSPDPVNRAMDRFEALVNEMDSLI